MIVKTGRFGELEVGERERIDIPQGMMGFPHLTQFILVDPGDVTLILWLQSIQDPLIAFPVLEPKIFKPDYSVRLSAVEMKELQLENINHSAVFNVLTIPEDATQMTANTKAPLVINLKKQIARQVVLQENEYTIKHLMFKELRTHLMTLQSHRLHQDGRTPPQDSDFVSSAVAIGDIPPSLTVRALQSR